jgi:protoporphyrinogen oxidase
VFSHGEGAKHVIGIRHRKACCDRILMPMAVSFRAMTKFDVIVVGAGLRGLHYALRTRADRPSAKMLVVEAQPWPGGDIRTQRSNGFSCELGPFAFTRAELEPLLKLLPKPPRIMVSNEAAKTGWLFDGTNRRALRVEPEPCSFPTGCEDIVQAHRRELDSNLRLGRAVTQVQPNEGGGFIVTLGGEVPTDLQTTELVLATSATSSARMLGGLEPELPHIAEQEQREQRAFVWLGCLSKDAPELHGYGVLPHKQVDSPMTEAIYCTQVFGNRAMADRCLVRAEVTMPELPEDDVEVVRIAEAELRQWTLTKAPFGFTKVHRFTTPVHDGCLVECRTRVDEIAKRVPGLSLAPELPDSV